ncbi:MAG: hypothetical protein IJP70_07305 [Bacteroidales bacterium]|nr:hypothetical protein [Bacteroidales bacterium]
MEYIIKPRAARKIYTFYGNVAKKYRHTYDKSDYKNNVYEALKAIYRIENGLLRRNPMLKRWAGYYMANTDKWYFAYTIEDDTVTVVDACHAQNMHEDTL